MKDATAGEVVGLTYRYRSEPGKLEVSKLQLIPSHLIITKNTTGKIIAFTLFSNRSTRLHIEYILVSRKTRKRNIAKSHIEQCKAFATKCNIKHIEAYLPSNTDCLALFTRTGFLPLLDAGDNDELSKIVYNAAREAFIEAVEGKDYAFLRESPCCQSLKREDGCYLLTLELKS